MIDALELKFLCRSQEWTCTGWPGNNKHYQIALLAPDGKYGLETGGSRGDRGDFWHEGMEIGPGPVDAVASVTVWTNNGDYPNTNSYISGLVVQTGIRIFNLSSDAEFMSFSVEGLLDPQIPQAVYPSSSGFSPTPTDRPSRWPSPSPSDRNHAASEYPSTEIGNRTFLPVPSQSPNQLPLPTSVPSFAGVTPIDSPPVSLSPVNWPTISTPMSSLMVTQSPSIFPISSISDKPSNGPTGSLMPSYLHGNSSSGTDSAAPSSSVSPSMATLSNMSLNSQGLSSPPSTWPSALPSEIRRIESSSTGLCMDLHNLVYLGFLGFIATMAHLL